MDAEEQKEQLEKNRKTAKAWGWAVYGGGVVVAWAFALAFFTKAMHGNPFLQVIVGIGVTFVSVNAIILANALHYYAVNGWHRGMAIGLYAADLILMVLNVLVSAGELTGKIPLWAAAYEPYAYSTIVLPVATWGVLWILDPWHAADVKKQAEKDKFLQKVIQKAGELLDTPDGKTIVSRYAQQLANGQIWDGKPLGIDGGNNTVKNTGGDTVTPDMEAALNAILEKNGFNGESKILAKRVVEEITNPTDASIKGTS